MNTNDKNIIQYMYKICNKNKYKYVIPYINFLNMNKHNIYNVGYNNKNIINNNKINDEIKINSEIIKNNGEFEL